MPRRPSAAVRSRAILSLLLLGGLALVFWLSTSERAAAPTGAPHPRVAPSAPSEPRLDRDEQAGGHTLERHVGRPLDQLRRRLRDEPSISAASTFTDRASAEAAVAGALAQESARVAEWLARGDRRDLAIDFRGDAARPVGVVLARGAPAPRSAPDARVVLRRRGATFFVLTAYPLEVYR